MAVLGYMEMPPDDSPPEEYWHSPEHLKEWFDAVKQRREERFGGSAPSERYDADDDMTGNELAKQYR